MKTGWALLIIMCCWYSTVALPVPAPEARMLAMNWYADRCSGSDRLPMEPVISESYQDSVLVYYLFTFEAGGFVITPADDALPPILGYSAFNQIDTPVRNPAVEEWLRSYRVQIVTAIERRADNRGTRPLWDAILERDYTHWQRDRDVAPLLETTWNQDYPYNSACPEDAYGSGGHVYAGCAATATAQVMKYWNSPAQGSGSHSYYHPVYGTIFADFGATNYDWLAMPNHSSNSNVATLLFHVGVALEMDYGPDGSSAWVCHETPNVVTILENYFSYNPDATCIWKDDYSDTVWSSLLRSQLDTGHPIVYRGQGTGGHAFVCDGYEGNDHFHFNWGWSGYYDGYYYLNNLNPGGADFTELQGAVIDIEPLEFSVPDVTISPSSFSLVMGSDQVEERILIVGNSGSGLLEFSFGCERHERNIAGSCITSDVASYVPGNTLILPLSLYNASPDMEWLIGASLDFPYLLNVLSSTDFTGGTDGPLETNNATGNGAEVVWSDNNGGWGNVYGGETATAIVEVEIAAQQNGTINIPYTIDGDQYGDNPHHVEGSLTLEELELPNWLELSTLSGTVQPGGQLPVSLFFSSFDLPAGSYGFDLLLNSNDPDEASLTIPISVEVTDDYDTIHISIQENYFELISFPLSPDNLDAATVFSTLEELVIVYAEDGGIYLPPNINTIGQIDPTDGYYVFSASDDILIVTGTPLSIQTSYTLQAGPWNWLGYPFLVGLPIEETLADIQSSIVIVQTDDGRLWIPTLELNTIGNMVPGEGYMVIVDEDLNFNFNYPVRTEHGGEVTVELKPIEVSSELSHFNPVIPTGHPYTLVIDKVPYEYTHLREGDEVAVFDGELCVGTAVYRGEQFAITAWQGEPTRNMAGFVPNGIIHFRSWSHERGESELAVEFLLGDGTFGYHPYSQVMIQDELQQSVAHETIPLASQIVGTYPNPFNPATTIEISLEHPTDIVLSVYNLQGQEVALLAQEKFAAGHHSIEWMPAVDCPAGIYFLQLKAGHVRQIRKLIYVK